MATPITTIVKKAPGVYVQEVPSGTAPIAGAGTSTAAFIGVISEDTVQILEANPDYDSTQESLAGSIRVSKTENSLKDQTLAQPIVIQIKRLLRGTKLTDEMVSAIKKTNSKSDTAILTELTKKIGELVKDDVLGEDIVGLYGDPPNDKTINFARGHKVEDVDLQSIKDFLGALGQTDITTQTTVSLNQAQNDEAFRKALSTKIIGQDFQLKDTDVVNLTIGNTDKLTALQIEQIVTYSTDATIAIKSSNSATRIKLFPADFPNSAGVTIDKIPEDAILCTNFGEFKASFGDFSKDDGQSLLAHSVYGFFRNGGSRCFVVRIKKLDKTLVEEALDKLATIDEISIVAAPGITDKVVLQTIADYIQPTNPDKLPQDWIAVFDAPSDIQPNDSANLQPGSQRLPPKSDRVAIYYPWIKVFDPVTKLEKNGDGLKAIPPSGHIAGIYARVDNLRGVHKAPANEAVLGADGLQFAISKAQQSVLNQNGINCIRSFNGTILVWGARTLGGDKNGEFKYVNVRRLFLYLRKSIDEGTQWTVFEPNSPELWSRIRRNINAFLLTVWRSGALFGDTPEQAFYVKCDEETNPPENRDLGVVVIEIGVAVVKPAEFVVFNLSQWAGAGK